MTYQLVYNEFAYVGKFIVYQLTFLANILFLIPLHHFLSFSLERALFEELFFVIVFATACEGDSDLYEITLEIDLARDEAHTWRLCRFSELEDVSAFEEEGFISQG